MSAGSRRVFVPTGQTGIAIAGWGISVDAVVADFIAGAAEQLVLEGAERGGELLVVEGQGSLSIPRTRASRSGCIHGSAPHALVLCHRPGTTEVDGFPGIRIPPLAELVELHERMALPACPPRVVALALNTARLDDARRRARQSRPPRPRRACRPPTRSATVRTALLDAVLERLS